MADKRPTRNKTKKDSQLIIRISAGERAAFVDLCDRLDTSASREIRRFMRAFVNANGAENKGADVKIEK